MLHAQGNAQKLPKENVIDVPAVGKGLCVSNAFQTNMVLQRDKPARIWGWANVGEKVTVSFAGQTQTATADKHRVWKVTLAAMPANAAPQTLTVQGKDKTLTLENILVGDVWLLGGQSNMEFPLSRIENGNLEIVSANYEHIRILTIPAQNGPDSKPGFARLHEWSGWFGRHYRKGDWDVCSPDIVSELSAIGYVFARRIHMATQVPIGVIDVSRGGTTVETWTPDPVLRTMETEPVQSLLSEWDKKVADYDPKKDLEDRIKRHHEWVARMKKDGKPIPADRQVPSDLRPGPSMDQNRPGNCYASMIAPIAGLTVKGAIFHQGYNNCFNGTPGTIMYGQVFPEMITAWRGAFQDPEMPFGILSLCTEGSPQTRDNYVECMANVGPYLREAQYKTFVGFYKAGDKNIGFTSTYDLRRRWYHPQLKIPAGERIARWALATQYGFGREIRWKPPMIKEMTVEDGRILLHMDEATANVDDGGVMKGFAIAGKDRKFHPADTMHLVTGKDDRGREQKDTKTLVLTSPMVPKPVHYRYAWGRSPMGNLQSHHNTDIPLATQRSDNWSLRDVYEALTGKKSKSAGALERAERNELISALRAEDMRRRLSEAEALIRENEEE
jgi:sialate O-acetylesterase